jgi:hypothetical protein
MDYLVKLMWENMIGHSRKTFLFDHDLQVNIYIVLILKWPQKMLHYTIM